MAAFNLRALVEPSADDRQIEREVSSKVERKLEEVESFSPSIDEGGMQQELSGLDLQLPEFGMPGLPDIGGEMSARMPSFGMGGADGGIGDAIAGEGLAAGAGRLASGAASRAGIGAAASGGAASGGAASAAGGLGALGGLVAGGALTVALGGAVGFGILKQLEKASPALQQSLGIMGQAWSMFWRPFGNALSKRIFPMAKGMIDFSSSFMEIYADEGLVTALKNIPEMLSDVDFGEMARGFGEFSNDVVNGIQEVLADWVGDIAEALFGEGVGRMAEGGARGFMEGFEFSMDELGPLGPLAAGPIGVGGALLGATGTDTQTFFNDIRDFDMREAFGEIDFSFVEESWPGWPSINTEWPGWPNISSDWNTVWGQVERGIPDFEDVFPDWGEVSITDLLEGGEIEDDFEPIEPVEGTGPGTTNPRDTGREGPDGEGGDDGGDDGTFEPVDPSPGTGGPPVFGGGARPMPSDDEPVGLQSGGIVTRPTRAIVGERETEAVAPLDDLSRFIEDRRPQEINVEGSNNREMLRKMDQLIQSFQQGLEDLATAIDDMTIESEIQVDGKRLADTTEKNRNRFNASRNVTR